MRNVIMASISFNHNYRGENFPSPSCPRAPLKGTLHSLKRLRTNAFFYPEFLHFLSWSPAGLMGSVPPVEPWTLAPDHKFPSVETLFGSDLIWSHFSFSFLKVTNLSIVIKITCIINKNCTFLTQCMEKFICKWRPCFLVLHRAIEWISPEAKKYCT